ncbi:MAG TPA: VOC family protein [Oligoflexia bacterium]|nr:VOC family protein [Oligoflexia bacterium]HMP48710.1 VOC family protein [Oligoflexia bacterium]
MKLNKLIPELEVTDFERSKDFYLGILGFKLLYDRPEEHFAMLDLEGTNLMIEKARGSGRRFTTAELEYPFGRGINLQIQVFDVDLIYERCMENSCKIIIPIEDIWYRAKNYELGNRQFVVMDPDGYMIRPFSDIGKRLVEFKG